MRTVRSGTEAEGRLVAADAGEGEVWYDELAEFVRTPTAKGTVEVPAR